MREKGSAAGFIEAHAASFGRPLCFVWAGELAWANDLTGPDLESVSV